LCIKKRSERRTTRLLMAFSTSAVSSVHVMQVAVRSARTELTPDTEWSVLFA
jgi:hypothetical protein